MKMNLIQTTARTTVTLLVALTSTAAFAAGRAPATAAQSGANKPTTNAIASETTTPGVNRVKFIEPVNGAKVPTKFKIKMGVEGYSIAALGTMTKGTGHHHLIIDGAAIPEGKIVPTDKTHIHFGKGQTETEIELTPGKHKLTLQFADGAHRSFGPGMSETIEVEVTK